MPEQNTAVGDAVTTQRKAPRLGFRYAPGNAGAFREPNLQKVVFGQQKMALPSGGSLGPRPAPKEQAAPLKSELRPDSYLPSRGTWGKSFPSPWALQ